MTFSPSSPSFLTVAVFAGVAVVLVVVVVAGFLLSPRWKKNSSPEGIQSRNIYDNPISLFFWLATYTRAKERERLTIQQFVVVRQ